MGLSSKVISAIFVATATLIFSNVKSYSDVFTDLHGVVTDPFKLGQASRELSSSLERTMLQLQQLEGITNAHVQERLEQIRSIFLFWL